MLQSLDIVKRLTDGRVGVVVSVSDGAPKPNLVEFEGNFSTREWFGDIELVLVSRGEELESHGFVPVRPLF